jgi:cytochrome c peroxidase
LVIQRVLCAEGTNVMTRQLDSLLSVLLLSASVALSPACMGAEAGDPDDPDLDVTLHDDDDLPGEDLFEDATFGGNGRTCETCHPSDDGGTGTLNPAQVQAKFRYRPNDPLFRHDGADVIGGNTFNRIKAHATILINMPLPATVAISGSSARNVILPRGIPTTMNTPALDPVLMYDGRAPNLQEQARGAILGHAQSSNVTTQQLNDIAAFQRTLFNRNNLKKFAQQGTPLTMPQGTTDSQKRGRRWFIDDGKSNPADVGESKFNVCGFCHSGPMLNELSGFFTTNILPVPEGFRFLTALVSEFNAMGNPVYDFEYTLPDSSTVVVPSPDPGIFLQSGEPPPFGTGWFKIPTVWGAKDTAPYFHDNSSKNLTEMLNHYDDAIFILSETDPVPPTLGQVDLTEQDKLDIIAYVLLL